MLISFGSVELLFGSVADLRFNVSPHQQIYSVFNKTEVRDYTVDCVGIKSNASCGFYDHHAINKTSSDSKDKISIYRSSQLLQAPANEKKRSRRDHSMSQGVVLVFMALTPWDWVQHFNTVRLQVWFQKPPVHSMQWTSTCSSWLSFPATVVKIHISNYILGFGFTKTPQTAEIKGLWLNTRRLSMCGQFKGASPGAALGVALRHPVFMRSVLLLCNLLWPVAGRLCPPLSTVILPYT